MTETEFLNHYSVMWGEDATEDLINRGFAPVLTTDGWKWIYCPDSESFLNRSRLVAQSYLG